ncbi:hypothetical protein K8W59_17200 [Nocardioides rotundus]|uniref:FGGY family carbohydrate kinase n=1 Tax=Nocardioides rotundus TaxID=1774216 RepID=UPI001CC02961|nr:FGGY family carbohydrate kinase [Nocardioides rotundus]UAL29470.1 hypothetical protein K8W59_17200 [Nocardioides rotundus]
MTTPEAWLGVDLGTSSLKVLAVGAAGALLDEREAAFAIDRPRPDQAEGDPEAWANAAVAAVDELAGRFRVRGLGLTGQMHGTVLLDEHGRALQPAVLWPDARAASLMSRWQALGPRALGRLGGPWAPGMTGPVLSWLAEHEPDVVARAERVALPKDYLREQWVPGAGPTDPSDASGTLLWDVPAGAWLAEADALVPARLLPDASGSDAMAGTWRDVPVHVGGGDTPVSLLALERAVGGWRPGDVVVNLGTGAQVIDPGAAPPGGSGWPVAHTYADVSGGHYAMVAAQNAGLALDWVQQRLEVPWDGLMELATAAPAGAAGVLFAPFLTLERGALATTVGAGWSPEHAARALRARAALEAQAFLVRRSAELLARQAERVLLVGGGARDPRVRQLLADILGRPVHHVPMRSAAAAGAVLLAGGPSLASGGEVQVSEPVPSAALEDAYARWTAYAFG